MDRVQLLSSFPLFESLSDEHLAHLSDQLEALGVKAGDMVFRQGEPGGKLYVIQEGEIEIAHGDGKDRIVLAHLFPGQFFGELSLLDGAPRSATACAMTDTRLLALSREDFVEFLLENPQAGVKIMAETAERMRQTNELMSRQVTRNVVEEAEDKLTFGQRVADAVASFGGSWSFIGIFAALMGVWMALNVIQLAHFDPYPFILLNLLLSTLAALQAPIIMMSQNRQAAKDKLLAQNDYLVNLKAELGIQGLVRGQGEILARMKLLERQFSGVSQRPASRSTGT